MKKLKITAIALCVLFLCVLVSLIAFTVIGYCLYRQGVSAIIQEAKDVALKIEIKNLEAMYQALSEDELDDLKKAVENRIQKITKDKNLFLERFDDPVKIYWDAVCFMDRILWQLKQYENLASFSTVKEMSIVCRGRLLMMLPSVSHRVELGVEKIPPHIFYDPQISAHIPDLWHSEAESLPPAKTVPPFIFYWDNGIGVSYYLSEARTVGEFLDAVNQFYSASDWIEVDYDLFFPRMSDLREDGWYEISGEKKLWSSYWVKRGFGLINVNLLHDPGKIVILLIMDPQLIESPANYDDWLRDKSHLDECIRLF